MKAHFYPQLDGLRGLAALIVLAHHYWPGQIWDPTNGRIGVDFFFVLSGFLITRSLLRDRREAPQAAGARLWRFYGRRLRRILPLFYGTLAIAAVLRWDRLHAALPWHLSFLTNLYFIREGHYVGTGGHLWFMAAEQHFYLVWPLVILFAPARWLRATPVLLILTGLLARGLAFAHGWPLFTLDIWTPTAFESLGTGAGIAFLLDQRDDRWSRRALWLSLMGLSGLGLLVFRLAWGGGPLSWPSILGTELSRAFLLGWLIVQAALGLPGICGRWLESTVARLLGRWSFALYLGHNFVREEVGAYFGSRVPTAQPFIALAYTLIWSALAYMWIEKPFSERRHAPRPAEGPLKQPEILEVG